MLPSRQTARAALGAAAVSGALAASLVAAGPASATTTLKAFSTSVTSSCSLAGQSSTLALTISGKVPKTVLPGSTFALTGLSLSVGFSASETSEAALFGVTSASATVSTLQFSVSSATPSVVDVLTNGATLSSGNIPVIGGQPATVRLPGTGTAAAKGFKAPKAKTTMTVTAGQITAAITASPLLNGSILSCQPSPTALTTIGVS